MAKWTKHHIMFPKKRYKTQLQKRYRSLPCNIVWMREDEHQKLHFQIGPPAMKSAGEMLEEIGEFERGECGCKHHVKRSHQLLAPGQVAVAL